MKSLHFEWLTVEKQKTNSFQDCEKNAMDMDSSEINVAIYFWIIIKQCKAFHTKFCKS